MANIYIVDLRSEYGEFNRQVVTGEEKLHTVLALSYGDYKLEKLTVTSTEELDREMEGAI